MLLYQCKLEIWPPARNGSLRIKSLCTMDTILSSGLSRLIDELWMFLKSDNKNTIPKSQLFTTTTKSTDYVKIKILNGKRSTRSEARRLSQINKQSQIIIAKLSWKENSSGARCNRETYIFRINRPSAVGSLQNSVVHISPNYCAVYEGVVIIVLDGSNQWTGDTDRVSVSY